MTKIDPSVVDKAIADGVDLNDEAQVVAWIAKYDAKHRVAQAEAHRRAALATLRAQWVAAGQTWPPTKGVLLTYVGQQIPAMRAALAAGQRDAVLAAVIESLGMLPLLILAGVPLELIYEDVP